MFSNGEYPAEQGKHSEYSMNARLDPLGHVKQLESVVERVVEPASQDLQSKSALSQ